MPVTSTEQVVDKGIRQKSTKEWTHSLTVVPFVRGHLSVFAQTPRNTGVYTRHPFVTATSGVLTRLPAKLSKKRNACLHAVRQAVKKKNCMFKTASEAKPKGLTVLLFHKKIIIYSNFRTIMTVWSYNSLLMAMCASWHEWFSSRCWQITI